MEKDQRIFRLIDAEAVQTAKNLHSTATADLTNLSAFDNSIDALFMDEWEAMIDAAEALIPDYQAVAILNQKTEEVEQCHAQCIIAVRDLRYHAGKAFTKKSKEWILFNFKGLAKARTSPSRLAVYLQVLYIVADGLRTELTNKGMKPAQIEALKDTGQALFLADVQQEHQKHIRLQQTFVRVTTMNHLWGYCQQVHKAGQIVFAENAAKFSTYALG